MSTHYVGQPLNRVDGRLKVTGKAQYTAEVPVPYLAHAVVVQSEIARGRILRMDTTKAEALSDVLAVLTPFTMPKLGFAPPILSKDHMGTAGQSHVPLQDPVIYYYGQHIGVVIAETWERAIYAASLIQVEYEREQPIVSIKDAPISKPDNVWRQPTDTIQGDIVQGMAEAAVCIEQTYITPMQNHNPMETHAVIAQWQGEELTLYVSSTFVYGVHKAVADWLQIPQEKIRVLAHYVGGSFGNKGPTYPHVALAAVAAQLVGRPVKLVLTREQEFTSVGHRPAIQQHLQLGATRDGRLTAIVHDAVAQTAIFDDRAVAPVTKTTRKLYQCPNVATSYRLAHLTTGVPGTMRGPGETPGLFAFESAMDELAYALNIDPIELRLRNYAEVDPEEGLPWSSKSLRECYRQGAERFGWWRRTPRPCSMRDGDMLVGWGMSTLAYDAQIFPTVALARMFADGTVVVQSSTSDQGTGTYTIMSQIAADALGVPIQNIRAELGDTRMPMAFMSAASTTASSVGSAVQASATSLRKRLFALALADSQSPLYGCREELLVAQDGYCMVKDQPDRKERYTDILKRQNLWDIEVTERIVPDTGPERYTRYAFGAHFAEVYIHPSSYMIHVNRHIVACSAGKILNAKTARSQLVGGITWGIGMALMEQTQLDPQTGCIVNANFGGYHVPVHADIPAIEAFFIDEDDAQLNRLGTKGIGELGTIGAAAAIANAVYHATGKRIRTLPITLDKFYEQ